MGGDSHEYGSETARVKRRCQWDKSQLHCLLASYTIRQCVNLPLPASVSSLLSGVTRLSSGARKVGQRVKSMPGKCKGPDWHPHKPHEVRCVLPGRGEAGKRISWSSGQAN